MTNKRKIHCCGCGETVLARLTNGAETYPHRRDLKKLPFWKCDACGNFVGCHHKTDEPTKPLGCIPTPELKKARQHIHKLIDPLWQNGKAKRGQVYNAMSGLLGYRYHTAEIRTIEEARNVYRAAQELKEQLA